MQSTYFLVRFTILDPGLPCIGVLYWFSYLREDLVSGFIYNAPCSLEEMNMRAGMIIS
jgi:hypothetical protein